MYPTVAFRGLPRYKIKVKAECCPEVLHIEPVRHVATTLANPSIKSRSAELREWSQILSYDMHVCLIWWHSCSWLKTYAGEFGVGMVRTSSNSQSYSRGSLIINYITNIPKPVTKLRIPIGKFLNSKTQCQVVFSTSAYCRTPTSASLTFSLAKCVDWSTPMPTTLLSRP